MCGIFGLWHTDGSDIDLDQLVRATASLRHRGPDDEGYLLADTATGRTVSCAGPETQPGVDLPPLAEFASQRFNLAWGFRRLSILDPSPLGHQPMTMPDGRFALMLNGEIYNYLELREELVRDGRTFRSQSDSEVLLAALAAWGTDALPRLVGMFAFALFDRDEPSLLLARDHFGIKPLYVSRRNGRVAFASQIAALLELPWVRRRADPQRLYDYLRFGLTDDGPGTMLADVRQVPAGHYLRIGPDHHADAQPRRYWRIDPNQRADLSFDQAASRLRELFMENVHLHLRSDVPVGACLSGGIDSSAIVMAMRRLAPNADLHAFTYCAEGAELGEEKWADLVGQSVRATLHKVRLDSALLREDLTSLIQAQDEPFGGTSIYAQYRVFRLARETGVKVLLDGQGADELLAGYRPFLAARVASLVRQGRWIDAYRLFRNCARLPGIARSELFQQIGGLLVPLAMQDVARVMARRPRVPAWLNRKWFERHGVRFDLQWTRGGRDVLREKLLETLTRTSLPMLLRYEDRNSMSSSVESRVPFLTPSLVQFVISLPEDYLIASDGTSKAVFRAAMRGLVSDAVLDRRDKIGFATSERDWLLRLRPWVEDVLADDIAARVPVLNSERVRREWHDMLEGRGRFDFRFWRWINLVVWAHSLNISFEG